MAAREFENAKGVLKFSDSVWREVYAGEGLG